MSNTEEELVHAGCGLVLGVIGGFFFGGIAFVIFNSHHYDKAENICNDWKGPKSIIIDGKCEEIK